MFCFGLGKIKRKKAGQTNPRKEVKCLESVRLKGLQSSATARTYKVCVKNCKLYTRLCQGICSLYYPAHRQKQKELKKRRQTKRQRNLVTSSLWTKSSLYTFVFIVLTFALLLHLGKKDTEWKYLYPITFRRHDARALNPVLLFLSFAIFPILLFKIVLRQTLGETF